MQLFDLIVRIAFGIASTMLMLLACALIVYGGYQVGHTFWIPESEVGPALLDAVGYTVIAIAVFDVGKYLLEEEAIRGREMRKAGEARRSMTKFMSTIAIAVFLESLVAVFAASKSTVSDMIYPTMLLLSGVALVVGLGVYQRLSVKVEQDEGRDPQTEEASANAKSKAASPGRKRS